MTDQAGRRPIDRRDLLKLGAAGLGPGATVGIEPGRWHTDASNRNDRARDPLRRIHLLSIQSTPCGSASSESGCRVEDYIENYRLVKCLHEGGPTDMNVYDAAALSVIGTLSEWSVANRSRPIDVPDFTRGRWAQWPRLEVLRA